MDTTAFLVAISSALLCLLVGVIVVHPGTREGPLINLGLGLMGLGLIAVSVAVADVTRSMAAIDPVLYRLLPALLALMCGGLVLVIGLVLRIRRSPGARAVASELTGWPDLDTNEVPR